MATIKAYTDIPQSKKLAKILSTESADMYYEPAVGFCTEPSEPRFGDIKYAHPRSIRCWSLAALLGVLPKIINNETLFVETSLALWHIGYRNVYIARADNLVDAYYRMILKLHELKML